VASRVDQLQIVSSPVLLGIRDVSTQLVTGMLNELK